MIEKLNMVMDDGINIHINCWQTEGTCKGLILLLHGMAEHSGRYNDFAQFLNNKGYHVYAWDHRGHGETGKSMKILGYFADEQGWNRVVKDIETITVNLKEKHTDLPIILMGHSMGSILARSAVQNFGNLYKGVILSGTTLGGSNAKLKMGKMITKRYIKKHGPKKQALPLDKISFGSFNKKFAPNETPFDWLSRDGDKVREYIHDGLCGFVCTGKFFLDLLEGSKETRDLRNISVIPKELPIYLFCGEKDPVSNMSKEVVKLHQMYKRVNIQDVSIKVYKDGRHEMLNEINREEVYDDVYNWIDSHVS